MKLVTRIVSYSLVSLILATNTLAQRVSTQKRGLSSPSTAVQHGNIDSVNKFSGALTVKLDLGPEYPIGRDFALRFQAVLNSSVWEFKPVVCQPQGPYDLPVPDDNYNLGHAWQILPLGQITFVGTHWNFRTADGGEHGLYPRLHHNYPLTVDPHVFSSTSSTYLRMRNFPSGSAECHETGPCVLLNFPTGEIREFHPRTIKGDTVYMPTRATDAFGNWLAISYPANGSWSITDIHGRSHTITFAGNPGDYERINQLRIAKFGGGKATYTFEYLTTSFERQGFVTSLCSSESSTVSLQALHRITQPDDSFYEVQYHTSDDEGAVLSGAIRSLRLPTSGEMRWTYTPLIIASQVVDPFPGPPPPQPKPIQKAYGVARKEVALTVGGAAEGTWTYTYHADLGLNVPGENAVPCHRTTTIRDPLGNEEVTYFTTSVAHRWSFALPFTRCAGGTYSTTGPYLSSETYSGSAETGTLLRSTFVEYESDGLLVGNGAETQEHNQRIIFEKVVYHDDNDVFKSVRYSDFDGLGNYRTQTLDGTLSAQDLRTVQINYNFTRGTLIVDPELGTSTGSSFVLPSPDEPWVLKTFDQQTVTAAGSTSTTEYCYDTTTGFLLRKRALAGASRASNDFVTVFESEESGGHSTGFVATESSYGGANQGSMDAVYSSLCDMTLPTSPEYRTEHTYHAGTRESTTAIDPCDGSAFLTVADQTIDTNTGLGASTRSPAGVQTMFVYDDMGRLIAEQPQDDAWLIIDYQFSTTTNPNFETHITAHACNSGSISCSKSESLSWERFHYDGLGRLTTERRLIPAENGLVDQLRNTTYNGLGLATSVSSWGNTTHVTTFADYDPFGRVGTITAADNQVTAFTYIGDRHVTRRTRVRSTSGIVFTYHTQTKDRHGRTIKVCEGQATDFTGSCNGVETTYLYDVGSRMTRVCENRDGEACGQIRRYLYDNRGVLIQERHPEVGINSTRSSMQETTIVDSDGFEEVETTADIGNDWIFYTVGSRGRALTKSLEGSTEFDLTYHYDAAGRLVLIEETNSGNPRPFKEFFYGFSNNGTDLRTGQLVRATRHNWVDIEPPLAALNPGALDAVISEVFRYEGPGGRLTSRQTRFSFAEATFAFSFSQDYDALGNVSSITYPQCLHHQGGCATDSPSRIVSYGNTKGHVTSVSGFATSISYQAAQTVHNIIHSNGVTYSYALDPSTGLSRPHEISTTAGWSTGPYAYDGSGNVTSIGNQQFRYDRLHRLVSGQVQVGAALRTQTVTYDDYGNITSLTTNGSLLATPSDPSSNRLSAPLATYDGAGNLSALDFGSERYEYQYDAEGMMKQLRSDTDLSRIFLYNANNERIAQFDCTLNVCQTNTWRETWTLRGFDNRVLRTYTHPANEGWHWKEDYVYAAGRPIAFVNSNGVFALHTDHLGSVRQVTDSSGSQVALHSYYPFGEEVTSSAQNDLAVKFTAHERDQNSGRGGLDYMHARYCSPFVARFLSPDPRRTTEAATDPQKYNRYTYGRNNPILFVDPNGEAIETGWDAFNVATGAASLGANLASGNIIGAIIDAGALTFDVAATALPGVPAGASVTIKAIRLTRNRVIGEAFEKAVLKTLNLTKNSKRTTSATPNVEFRVPDALQEAIGKTKGTILEIKSGSINSRAKKQIQDFVTHASDNDQVAVLVINKGTNIPKKIQDLVDANQLTIIQFEGIMKVVE